MTDHDDRRIQPLDSETIQQIAAGEVVERPASVVKELLENSLDAGASRIEIAVENGGKDAIRVSDNGQGIRRSELPRALEEHATSKIQTIEDLDGGLASLGFRGEALSTIGAVSQLTIRSRPQGTATGAELTIEGGDLGEITPAGCPEGTTVEIERLFFNTPARKKFLKRDSTEFDHINTVVSQYALANPDVALSLSHNGRMLFRTEGGGSLRAAVLAIYGRDVAESMIELGETVPNDAALKEIYGLISHPETTRSTREYLATFVNGRYVTDSTLRRAVLDGYGGQLAADRYPFAVVFLEVPPASVDVNVHPRKTEVRFDNDEAVMTALSETVERTLLEDGLIRSGAPRGRSAPAETPVEPDRSAGLTDDTQSNRSTETRVSDDTAIQQEGSPASAGDTFGDDQTKTAADQTKTAHQQTDQTVAKPLDPNDEASWTVEGLGGNTTDTARKNATDKSGGNSAETSEPTGPAETEQTAPSEAESADMNPTNEATLPTAESHSRSEQDEPTRIQMGDAKPIESVLTEDGQFRTASTQQTLSGERTTDQRTYDRLPALRVLGQLHETYLLAATDDGLVLIDQHAADERVNYERLQKAIRENPTSQRLADPVVVELTARETALFADHSDELAAIGFEAERQDDRTITVTAVPAVFSTSLDPELLREALVRFVESTDGASHTIEAAIDKLLADLACYPSVTGNTSLTEGSVVELLAALDSCGNPYACPHGRPVIIEISRQEIEDRFERDYPGHSGRRAE